MSSAGLLEELLSCMDFLNEQELLGSRLNFYLPTGEPDVVVSFRY